MMDRRNFMTAIAAVAVSGGLPSSISARDMVIVSFPGARGRVECRAIVSGALAVTPHIGHADLWSITHLPSGRRIPVDYPSIQEALAGLDRLSLLVNWERLTIADVAASPADHPLRIAVNEERLREDVWFPLDADGCFEHSMLTDAEARQRWRIVPEVAS